MRVRSNQPNNSAIMEERNKDRENRLRRGLGNKYSDTLWLDISLWEVTFKETRLGAKG